MKSKNHLLWLGPVVAVFGLLSYFMVFVYSPSLRDSAWLNLVLVFLGGALTAVGAARAWKAGGALKRSLAGGALFLSVTSIALLATYVFWLSYQLPEETETTRAIADNHAGGWTATDENGATFAIDDLRGKQVLLVFYRGHW